MGTQFWWILDISILTITLISVFLSGKKGFAKTVIVMVGYLLGVFLAASVSGSSAEFIYKKSVKQSNISAIQDALSENDFASKTKSYIDGLGYNVTVSTSELNEIFSDGGDINSSLYTYVNSINGRTVDTKESFDAKMTEGFAEIMNNILSSKLTRYAGEMTEEKIRSDMSGFNETLAIMYGQGGSSQNSATYIEENYTAESSIDILKIFCFIIIILFFMTIIKIIAEKLNNGEAVRPIGDIANHVVGGIIGIIEGVVLSFIFIAAVRACVILGNNEMILFNSETIDKTILFKYIYSLMVKL